MTRPVKNPSQAKALKTYRDKIKRTNPDLHEAHQEAKRAARNVSNANLSAFMKGERNPIVNPNLTLNNASLIKKLSEPGQKEFFRVVNEYKNKNKAVTGNMQTYFQNEVDRLRDDPEFEEDFEQVSALNLFNLSNNWNKGLGYVTKGRRKYGYIDSKLGTVKNGYNKKTTPEPVLSLNPFPSDICMPALPAEKTTPEPVLSLNPFPSDICMPALPAVYSPNYNNVPTMMNMYHPAHNIGHVNNMNTTNVSASLSIYNRPEQGAPVAIAPNENVDFGASSFFSVAPVDVPPADDDRKPTNFAEL